MTKKSIIEKSKDFVEASSSESNEPMTKGEIATAMARKRGAPAPKRPAKAALKAKKAAKKNSTQAKKAKSKSKR